MPGSNKMLKKAMFCICFIYRLLQKSVIGSPHPKFIEHNEAMTGKVSGSQGPNSPEGEKQGWPVKVVRAGVGGSGFWRVFMEVGREEKTVRREEG